MVLDGVVCPAWQVLSYLSPLVTILCMLFDKGLILIVCPVTSFYVWIKVIVPSALQDRVKSGLLYCVLLVDKLSVNGLAAETHTHAQGLPFSTLLANASRKVMSNKRPSLSA